ncbi:MAG: hypothetical protein WEG36_14375 [Gemmatimonadota bacterium]
MAVGGIAQWVTIHGDDGTVAALEAIGPPPWEAPPNFGILRGLPRACEAGVANCRAVYDDLV